MIPLWAFGALEGLFLLCGALDIWLAQYAEASWAFALSLAAGIYVTYHPQIDAWVSGGPH